MSWDNSTPSGQDTINKEADNIVEAQIALESAFDAEHYFPEGYHTEIIERFASLVRQDEREACAKLCDLHANNGVSFLCAATIRARGNDESLFDN